MSRPRDPARGGDQRGIVLVVVLFFALLLASTVATFTRKALIDHMIVKNRDDRARAEALARGGLRLAHALLLEDKFQDQEGEAALNHREELWALASGREIVFEDGSLLRVEIEDVGSRLNLNAALAFDEAGNVDPNSSELVLQLLMKAIDEIPRPPGEKLYDVSELAANLIDYVDEDPVRQRGGPEDDAYQQREPPTRPANRALLSVDELRRVEGFDADLVEALEPYVTVYPLDGSGGINPNTAPPHVLGLLFFNDGVSLELAPEDVVRQILQVREDGGTVCADPSEEGCTPIGEIVTTNAIFPNPSYSSDIFQVVAHGQVGEIHRRIEAVLDRSQGSQLRLLSWRMR